MTLRRGLNVAWRVMTEGLEYESVEELRKAIDAPLESDEQQAEREKLRKARETQAGVAGLAQAFAAGR